MNLPPSLISVDKDFSKICRTCCEERNLLPIHLTRVELAPLTHLLETYALIKVLPEDGLPQNICIKCVKVLQQIYEFRKKSHQTEQILRKILDVLSSGQKSSSSFYQVDFEEGDTEENQENSNEHRVVFIQEATNIEGDDDCIYTDNDDDIGEEILIECNKMSVEELYIQGTPDCEENFSENDAEELKNCDTSSTVDLKLEEEKSGANCGNEPQSHRTRPKSKKVDKLAGNNKKKLECPICGQLYLKKTLLDKHMTKHTGILAPRIQNSNLKYQQQCKEKNVLCEVCGISFGTKSDLGTHMEIHTMDCEVKVIETLLCTTKGKNVICHFCGKSFGSRSMLGVHMQVHTADAKVKVRETRLCTICGVTVTKSSFYNHQKIHTDGKRFACEECGKTFISLGILNVHLISHTGDKPYKCLHCEKGFGHQSNLSRHVRIVHRGERAYICCVCKSSYGTKENLKFHMNIHTGETPYRCDSCGKGFKHPTTLKKHQRGRKCGPKLIKYKHN